MTAAPAAAANDFRIYTAAPGIHSVSWEDLEGAGLDGPVASERIGLRQRGEPVPLWIEDGGDGEFGPGDRFEWRAEKITGEHTFHHPHMIHNVYWLSTVDTQPQRYEHVGAAWRLTERAAHELRERRHFEENELLIRLSQRELDASGDPEIWYWAKLTHIDSRPFTFDFDTSHVDSEGSAARLRMHFRALSEPREHYIEGPHLPDHQVDVLLNGETLHRHAWNGDSTSTLQLDALPPGLLRPGANQLTVRVPKRNSPGSINPIVDVVMLDWVELEFPRLPVLTADQAEVETELPEGEFDMVFQVAAQAAPVLYSNAGRRIAPTKKRAKMMVFSPVDGETRFTAASSVSALRPAHIERDTVSSLASGERQADYLMISHGSLLAEIKPLADAHRRRGLTVEVVDVQDVYDEFSAGIVEPQAIRDFIAHAASAWREPAPRFVLLVGDASWDSRSENINDANYANLTRDQLLDGPRFTEKQFTSYADQGLPRNLIPTWTFHSSEGHSASDNYFVRLEGDDLLPDMAIGRFPVARPEEVRTIVEKTVGYLENPPVGPWRRKILWITNDQEHFQTQTDRLADAYSEGGFEADKVYPTRQERDNAEHQQRLVSSFDEGNLVVHFFGHGGRLIWRTGPPSLIKNHDLFTLDHIEQLEPTERLPLVLSMTCFSAPFDHPSADSIGEKMLRTEDRGAVAVVASSWRTPASLELSRYMLPELVKPGMAIGTAMMLAKQQLRNPAMLEMFNLLGDPAAPLPLPGGSITIRSYDAGSGYRVEGEVTSIDGPSQAIVDWLDHTGAVLASEELQVTDSTVEAVFSGEGTPSRVSIYAWNEAARVDAIGVAVLQDSTVLVGGD